MPPNPFTEKRGAKRGTFQYSAGCEGKPNFKTGRRGRTGCDRRHPDSPQGLRDGVLGPRGRLGWRLIDLLAARNFRHRVERDSPVGTTCRTWRCIPHRWCRSYHCGNAPTCPPEKLSGRCREGPQRFRERTGFPTADDRNGAWRPHGRKCREVRQFRKVASRTRTVARGLHAPPALPRRRHIRPGMSARDPARIWRDLANLDIPDRKGWEQQNKDRRTVQVDQRLSYPRALRYLTLGPGIHSTVAQFQLCALTGNLLPPTTF